MYAGFLQSDIIESEPGVVETFIEVDSNVSWSTSGNSVVGATSVQTSVGVCCSVCGEERESKDWQREQETHLL